tara:strand:- start:207 stop:626 length:420 start_codon:yes stop_codon:yes gene_type:complete
MKFIYTILLLSLSAIGLAYFAYRIYLHAQKEQKDYLENNEFNNSGEIRANLLFFYADWCDHCQTSKPIWENVKKDTNFLEFNVNFVDIDGDDEKNEKLLKHYNIKEYPTIILDRNNKKYIFDAELESETLLRFMTSVYN